MRKRLFEIIEFGKGDDTVSYIYDMINVVVIIASLIPLAFKHTTQLFITVEKIATYIFIIDYIARYITADLKVKKGALSFVIYPFTFFAIIDLLAILPSFHILTNSFRLFKMFRMVRAMRVIRIFKVFRYSTSFEIIGSVIRKQRRSLSAVCILAIGYIFICALVIFNIEADTFDSFFEAVYWATVSLTTVGYGDIYPVTKAGQIITMLSSLVGIAIVALPAGIITAGYMEEIQTMEKESEESYK